MVERGRKKAEEKARKAEEKARKAEEKARKVEENAQKAEEKLYEVEANYLSTARKLSEKGFDIEQIAQLLNLPVTKIQKWLA